MVGTLRGTVAFSLLHMGNSFVFNIQNMFMGLVPTHLEAGAFRAASSCRSILPSALLLHLTESSGAANSQDYRLCMAKDCGDFTASWAFHSQKVGTGALHQALFHVFPCLLFWRWMKKILCKGRVLVGSGHHRKGSFCFQCDSRSFLLVSPSFVFLFYDCYMD